LDVIGQIFFERDEGRNKEGCLAEQTVRYRGHGGHSFHLIDWRRVHFISGFSFLKVVCLFDGHI